MKPNNVVKWLNLCQTTGMSDDLIRRCLHKMIEGEQTYGVWEPTATETRNFWHEIESELLDCINYCIMGILRQEAQEDAKKLILDEPTYDITELKRCLRAIRRILEIVTQNA